VALDDGTGEQRRTTVTITEGRALLIARVINIAALAGLLVVLSGSMDLQFGFAEAPCPLCLVQRSGMIGLAVGPILNLLWGMRPAHYAVSILAATVGGAGSVRQILLHIADPNDPGYGPAVLGLHLYTWAFITFVIAIVGCAVMLLWSAPFSARDEGVLRERSPWRTVGLIAIIWIAIDTVVMGLSVLPECGLGMCPDNPDKMWGLGNIGGLAFIALLAGLATLIAVAVERSIDRKDAPRS